jgi:uncharacterized membrane protein
VVYSFTASLVIGRSEYTSGIVPAIAFVAVLVSLVVYRRLQMAAFKSIQLASTLAGVASRGREVIDGLYTRAGGPRDQVDEGDLVNVGVRAAEDGHEIRWPGHAATLQVIDVPRVLGAAERAKSTVVFRVGAGDALAEGAVIAVASGEADPELAQHVLHALTVGDERTFEQDPALPLRLLADIALRALSPAVNDPTTAVQALDAADSILRALATRDLDIGRAAGRDGTVSVSLVLPTWKDYVAVTLDDITSLERLAPSVTRRIRRLLDDLAAIVASDRRPELEIYRLRVADQQYDAA